MTPLRPQSGLQPTPHPASRCRETGGEPSSRFSCHFEEYGEEGSDLADELSCGTQEYRAGTCDSGPHGQVSSLLLYKQIRERVPENILEWEFSPSRICIKMPWGKVTPVSWTLDWESKR